MPTESSSRPAPRQTRRPQSVVSLATIALAGVVLVSVGALITALLLPVPPPESVMAAPGGSETVAVSSEIYDGAHQVAVTPQLAEAQVVRSPASGVVTRSDCMAGVSITSGSSALAVDGRPIAALSTDVPLWRDLTAGDKGADVWAVQTELARLGYAVTPDGTYGGATQAAMRALWESLGATSERGDLLLSSVMWLPTPEVVVASCSLRTGDPVSAGDAMADAAGALQALILAKPPGEGWVARYGGVTAEVNTAGRIDDAEFLAAVETGPEMEYYTASHGNGALAVDIALAQPRDVLVVPPSAVIVSGEGKGCVVSDGTPIPVDIISSSLGRTMVAVTSADIPTEVSIHPGTTVRCP